MNSSGLDLPLAALKLELLLKWYFETNIGDQWRHFHAGHALDTLEGMPRCIITCAESGGALSYAGIEEIAVTIQILQITEPEEDDTAQAREELICSFARLATDIRWLLCEENLDTLLLALNRPRNGPDLRPVRGFGLSGLEFNPNERAQKDGRDAEAKLQGSVLNYTACAHLEADD